MNSVDISYIIVFKLCSGQNHDGQIDGRTDGRTKWKLNKIKSLCSPVGEHKKPIYSYKWQH